MFRFISHIKFLLTSNNQHGIHSPFVYDYITKCLYQKKELKLPATLKVLIKSIAYFKYDSIRLIGDYKTSEEILKQHFTTISIIENNADIIVCSISDLSDTNLDINNLSNDCMLLLDNIHTNSKNFKTWTQLTELKHVRVSIDMFYCGALFFRKEQVKEHFKIRI
ncbi:hypothetical protein SAMN04488007_1962 [Maribacter aquivivus]|uniref:Uncharacterized protein n=1 Tax=Maribacter aquivivus TaxID=228958 RepID=A0A1M6N9S4_9FLAO|nr:hypothetical protein [Maribacter aquivivus]SHJ92387.1 hypothetical protein SAMN04488007_1962 [Maribacter aquivivus]